MIVIDCKNENYAKESLTQWDYGQEVLLSGLEVDRETIEVHFALRGENTALIVIGTVQGGDVTAKIPNELLRAGKNLMVYVYLTLPNFGKTTYKAEIEVKKRAKPQDYDAPDEQDLLRQILSELDTKADDMKMEENELQLMSKKKGIGSRIRLPSGSGDMTSITNQEIDEIMKGE
ncbi:MAG: hypothetical protein KHW68_08880 [Lachnospiraceae bacterium]|nr:hypothetical protein [Lachnospiraceae bacterium]